MELLMLLLLVFVSLSTTCFLKWRASPSITYTPILTAYSWAVLKYPRGSPFCWYLVTVYSVFSPWMSLLRGCSISMSKKKKRKCAGGPNPSLNRADDVNNAFFFCHLVARFTSAWMHLPSNLCTCSIAKTTTMHERSVFFFFFATLPPTESESLKIWTSHPWRTTTASLSVLRSASHHWHLMQHGRRQMQRIKHDRQFGFITAVCACQWKIHSPEGLKKNVAYLVRYLKRTWEHKGFSKLDVRCCHLFIKHFEGRTSCVSNGFCPLSIQRGASTKWQAWWINTTHHSL